MLVNALGQFCWNHASVCMCHGEIRHDGTLHVHHLGHVEVHVEILTEIGDDKRVFQILVTLRNGRRGEPQLCCYLLALESFDKQHHKNRP